MATHPITANGKQMSASALRVLRLFLGADDEPKKKGPKRMVIMCGPPAAGKGFFVGDPDKDIPGSKYGWKLPESTHGLFTKDDIPDNVEYDESDNHLKYIQRAKADDHHRELAAAHAQGEEAYNDKIKDFWYETKDGKRVQLGDVVPFNDFNPKDPDAFYKKANKDFYVSMRGWHDEYKDINPETGKPRESFKDDARHLFDDAVNKKVDKDQDFLIVDSAGEDIDAQDFKSQIERAKANGFEVTVVFLHPEQADTELSNLARGKVQGKRMVDQADIDNWYKNNAEALKDIQDADPQNFLHYRGDPPDKDPKKAADLRARARDLMNALPPVPVQQKGESLESFKAKYDKWKKENKSSLDEINTTLYTRPDPSAKNGRRNSLYPADPDKRVSWGKTLDHSRVAAQPHADVAEEVQKMNEEADARAAEFPEARVTPPKKKPEKSEKKAPAKEEGGEKKEEGGKKEDKSRMRFLRDQGDRKVPNPNADSRKTHPQVKIRSLDWPEQKKYYHQWAQREAAVRVASRFREIIMADETKNRIDKALAAVANYLQENVKEVADYDVEVQHSRGPVIYVTLKGAQGDVTTSRKARPELQKLAEDAVKKFMPKDNFKVKITASNKEDDLMYTVEVLFP